MGRTPLGALLAAMLVFTVGSCGWPLVSGCSGVGYYALQVPIRDLQGNPQALNATVTVAEFILDTWQERLDSGRLNGAGH